MSPPTEAVLAAARRAAEGRPLLGVTTGVVRDVARVSLGYVRALERAGARPVLLAPVESAETAEALVALVDGVVVPGGPGIVRGLVGTLPEELEPVDPVRAAFDEAVLRGALDLGRPVLGICYGMQLLNVLCGGTLYGDVERERPGSLPHSERRGANEHPIRIEPGTHLARILGVEARRVNSRHFQAVAAVGAGLRVAAVAPDGVVEAVEGEDGRILGVQFHPERMGPSMAPLFAAFVDAARVRRRTARA